MELLRLSDDFEMVNTALITRIVRVSRSGRTDVVRLHFVGGDELLLDGSRAEWMWAWAWAHAGRVTEGVSEQHLGK